MLKMKYPFTPELLDALPEELAELFRGLELTLLEEICRRLKIKDNLNEVTIQDIRALRSHGIDLEDIKKAISENTNASMDKLNKLFDDVVERNQKYYTDVIGITKVTMPDTLVNQRDIEAIRKQTQDEFSNLTRSMGFLVGAGRTMLPPASAYQWALDSAELQIQSGAISYTQAIETAVKQLADSGLKTVNYESGHVDSVDVATRRAVMTGVNQINQQYREQSMEYLDTDLVEVTAHQGARDIDGPLGWENHKKWQGKVYRWKRYKNLAQEDVTDEYINSATPGIGSITYSNGYDKNSHLDESKTAKFLHDTLGGEIRLLQESKMEGVKRADYLWRGKLWDLKTVSKEISANTAIQRGLSQIKGNPGGIILNYGDKNISLSALGEVINRRMQWIWKDSTIDIIVLQNGSIIKVWRYKK